MTCERCFESLNQGEHGIGLCPFKPRPKYAAVIPDDVPGGFWAENGFDRPRKFYSKAEHRAALTAEGCELRVKYAGEHDKHVTNWAAAVDAKTLENAAVLLSRGKIQIDRPEPETLEPIAKRSVPGPIPDGVQHG